MAWAKLTASCGLLGAGWGPVMYLVAGVGQIKQKLSCDYRYNCSKAVSPWVRVPQQLLVHGMLVVCTSYHHVVYAIPRHGC